MGEIYPEDNSENKYNENHNIKKPSLQVLDSYGTNITKFDIEGRS